MQSLHCYRLSLLGEVNTIYPAMNSLFYLFSSLALTSGMMVIGSRNPVHSVLFLILVFFNSAGLLILLQLDFFGMIFLVVYVGAIAVLFLFVVMMLNVRLTEMNERRLRYLPIGGLLGFLFLAEVFLIVDNDLIPPLWTHSYLTLPGNEPLQSQDFLILQEPFLKSSQGSLSHTPLVSFSSKAENTGNLLSENGNQALVYGKQEPLVSHFPCEDLQWTGWSQLVESVTPIEAVGELIYTYYFFLFLVASLILLVAMIGAIVLTLHKGVLVKRQEVFQQNTREFAKTIANLS
jgi:NADH:ubiquinone oxidoreductase subunit 6 (subunit J)